MKYHIPKRLLAMILAVAMILAWLPFTAADAASSIDAGSKVADESTMNSWKTYFGRNDTAYAGAIWTDKSVFTNASAFADVSKLADGSANTITVGEDNFLVALSAMASTSQMVGYSTTPTDTILVLDVSGSMAATYTAGYLRQRQNNRYTYTEVTANTTEIVESMVSAANDAIHKLLTLNRHNRVGVVLYSGNTVNGSSSTSTGTLLLPLGRYEGVNGAYLSADITNTTQTLYEQTSRNNYASMGSVTYCTDLKVSLANGIKTEDGASVTDVSKTVVGGTYIQNGLDIAWDQFNGRIQAGDTVIPEGLVQAGTKRMPIMVLMSDGSPTTATTSYNDIGTSMAGNGTTNHATAAVGFLTQLTASWIRQKMEDGYATAPRFYTLGLADAGTQATAVGVLNPSSATNNAATYWNTFLSDGSVELTLPKTNSQNDTQKATVTALDQTDLRKNYVDQYWYASDAAAMISAFTQIVDEIILQSKYYATLVESGQHNVDGYITLTDEIGEFMEVKKVTGIVLGGTLYSGLEMAHALTTGILGSPSGATALGNEFVWTVMERMGITEVSTAQQLINAAYAAKQLWAGDATAPASNYIGWYADAKGDYLAPWNDTHTAQDAPANAVYINKSYGYLGKNSSNLTSDMMHIVVKVSTRISNGRQAVEYQIPASLIPMVTYTVGLDSDSLDTAQNITLSSDVSGKAPMRLLFEVGLKEGINSVNVNEVVGNSDHFHKNDDGSYSFYSNRWGITDLNDPANPTSHLVATAHFHPSMENEYYRFKEPETVLSASGAPVSSLDLSGNTQYYYNRQVIAAVSGTQAKVSNVLMPLSFQDLQFARNVDGSYVIPLGAPNMPANDVRMTKTDLDPSTPAIDHPTDTLDYYAFPYGVYASNSDSYDVYTYLGNNGTFTLSPATGLKLTKTVTQTIDGAEDAFTFTITLSENAPNASVTDANGNPKGEGWSISGNVITVTVKADETVCIIGLPEGASYTVEEVANDYISKISPAAGTVEAQKLIAVNAVNSPLQHGDLLISKEVVHPYDTDPDALAEKEFTFSVVISGSNIAQGQTYESTLGTLAVGENGVLTNAETGNPIVLRNDGSVTVYGLPEGTAYQVIESNIPSGFALDSVNGDKSLTAAVGSITANETASAEFVNRYPANGFEELSLPVSLTVEKVLDDPKGLYSGDEDFEFVLQKLIPGTENYQSIGTITSKANAAGVMDHALSFTELGTYHFRIMEVAGSTPGMTYSTTRALFAVTVTDENMDGKLEIKAVTNEAHVQITHTADQQGYILGAAVSAVFTNTYDLQATSTTVGVHKTLVNNTGAEKSATEFSFGLFAADAEGNILGDVLQTVTSGALGDATFTLNVVNSGTFHYVIREMIPAEAAMVDGKPVLNGMTYDTSEYLLTVTAEADPDGVLSVTEKTLVLLGGDGALLERADFTNTYRLTKTDATVSFVKNMEGRNLLTSDTFTFYVERVDATFTQLHSDTSMNITYDLTVASDESNSLHSAGLRLGSFTKVGTYHFRLREAGAGTTVNGVTYDEAVYHITVTVTDKGDGTLQSAVLIHKLGQPEPLGENEYAQFVNVYQVTEPATLNLSGVKTLVGRALNAGEFSFTLEDENGTVLQTVSNHAAGKISFEGLTFTPAQIGNTYTYTVKEVQGDLGGISYSKISYTVKVTVTDNGKGGVALQPQVTKNDGASSTLVTGDATAALNFVNTYTTQGVSVTLRGTKTLTGRSLKDGEFSFQLLDQNGKVLQTVVNEDGQFRFDSLYYSYTDENRNALGKHYYVIRELIPELGSEDRMGGVWYDATTYEVEVSVTDLNGKMSASVTVVKTGVGEVGRGDIHFGNTYTVDDEDSLVLSGTKTLVGRELAEKEFAFQLIDENGKTVQSVYNNADGSFAFDALTFDESDLGKTYTYTVKEWIPAQEDERLGGVIYSDKVYTVVVKLTDKGDGTMNLSYTVDGKSEAGLNSKLDFMNLYGSEAVYVTLGGTKQITGDRTELTAGDVYTFELVDAATGLVVGTATNDGTGSFAFEKLTFTYTDENVNDLGDHYYIIREVQGSLGGVTYSQTHYDVKIVISDGGGQLSALVVVQKDDSEMVSKNDILFVNTYTVADTEELILSGTKTLVGRALGEKEFSFELLDKDGNVLQTVENDAAGAFSFEKLTYTVSDVGTHTYTVREFIPAVENKLAGVSYTDKVYKVEVTVTDNGDGTLSLSYTVDGKSEAGLNGKLDFTNTYAASSATVTLSGTKQMDGDRTELIASDIYSFQLLDTDGNVLQTVQNDAAGAFSFDTLTYTYTDENVNDLGVHTYRIREVVGSHGGVDFDETEYAVKVTVTDEGGKLAAAVAISTDKGAAQNIVYTNLYAVTSTTITLEGTKTLVDRELYAGQFLFAVLEDGEEVSLGTNDGRGVITFEDITYTGKGTHTYTVVEKIPEGAQLVDGKYVLGNYTYDSASYTVTVEVVDNGDGTLTATATYAEPVTFVNSYTPDDLMIPVTIKKTTETDSTEEFSPEGFLFALEANGQQVATTVSDADGNAAFWLQLGKDSVGSTVTLQVYEVEGNETGVIYDDTVYTITVTVEQDAVTGNLSAKYTVNEQAAEKLEVSFHNVYEEPQIPETGDETMLVLWGSLMLAAAAGMVLLLVGGKKKEQLA